jgi:aminopeptidase N
VTLAAQQFTSANCMSDKLSAMASLVSLPSADAERQQAIERFYTDAAGDALVINKWFSIQAMGDRPRLLDEVKRLKSHPEFTLSNPNRARSLLSVFTGNMLHFHAKDGAGYEFIADSVIEIDRLNPQVAARMAGSFSLWRRFDVDRQALMKQAVERIKNTEGLSKDTFEVCLRTLK